MTGVVDDAGASAPETSLLVHVLAALSDGTGLRDTLQRCAEAAVDRLDAAVVRIWTLDEAGATLELQASAGSCTMLDGRSRIGIGDHGIGRLAAARQPSISHDLPHDDLIDPAWARSEGVVAFAGYPLVAGSQLVGVMAIAARHAIDRALAEALAAVAHAIGAGVQRLQLEAMLRAERSVLQHLHRVGMALSSAQLDLHAVVQTVTDSATELAAAQFGAFFYNVTDENGDAYMLYTLSGAPADAFARFPLPRNTPLFETTFRGAGVLRLDDVTADPRYGQVGPHHGMPEGHLPVRSYLAVPVIASDGSVLGGLFLGHAEMGVFTDLDELAVSGIAGHAAAAIENARLYERQQVVALTLQRSLLPDRLPVHERVGLAAEYVAASGQADVGGDWYDAVLLPGGKIGLSVGDVAGHDIRAAATMGQIRNAVRAYLLEGADVALVVERLERFLAAADGSTMSTLVCGILDPAERTLRLVRAGHPMPLVLPRAGPARFVGEPGVPPAGCGLIRPEALAAAVTSIDLEPGATVVLYTDGLVERRHTGLDAGMARLIAAAEAGPRDDPAALCAALAAALGGAAEDDIVVMASHLR